MTRWAVAVMTAKRDGADYLLDSLRSIAAAGWHDHLVCAEPDAPVPRDAPCVRWASPTGGPWPALRATLATLRVTQPEADRLLVFQDDVEVTQNARPYVESTLPASGIVSLYTCRRLAIPADRDVPLRWSVVGEPKPRSFGSLGLVFTPGLAADLLRDPPAPDKLAMDDYYVARWCRDRGVPIWIHHPSLIRHTGVVSSLPNPGGIEADRNCAEFLQSC